MMITHDDDEASLAILERCHWHRSGMDGDGVLLSFAQFERDVTGERIRDKIAASKAKGIWMGGVVPLG